MPDAGEHVIPEADAILRTPFAIGGWAPGLVSQVDRSVLAMPAVAFAIGRFPGTSHASKSIPLS